MDCFYIKHNSGFPLICIEWIRTDSLYRVKIFGWITGDSLWGYTNLYGHLGWVLSFLGVDVFCKHSVWISTNAFLGNPQTPAPFLRDDSDADDACDAVLRISLYHIPDSASLASSASFWFCVSRNIIIFVSSSSKLQASFRYKCDGDDDDDGVRGIG